MTQELQVAISRGDTARVAEVCKAFGHSDVVADMFLAEFNESRSHRYDWGTITDRELQTLVRDYLSNGYITMRKPLAFSSDRSFATNQNRATPISFERAQKACRNPNVPDYLLRRAVEAIKREHTHMTDAALADAINAQL